MAKGDDHIQKKKSKVTRKRNRRAGADSLEAIRGVQAAKLRRKNGVRRKCEGMCYTLPTPDDPFNSKGGKQKRRKILGTKSATKPSSVFRANRSPNSNGHFTNERSSMEDIELRMRRKRRVSIIGDDSDALKDEKVRRRVKRVKLGDSNLDAAFSPANPKSAGLEFGEPSGGKLMFNGLPNCTDNNVSNHVAEHFEYNSKQNSSNALLSPGAEDNSQEVVEKKVLNAVIEAGIVIESPPIPHVGRDDEHVDSTSRRKIWKVSHGSTDVLATISAVEDSIIAYVVLAAAHIQKKMLRRRRLRKPLALIIVATQTQACRVRCFCKPLKKALGIKSVSLHSGTSLERQIKGLGLQTPEFVVGTPDRLCDLIAEKAISFSSTSFLVIDGLHEIIKEGFEHQVNEIIYSNLKMSARKLINSHSFSSVDVSVARNLLKDPITRMSFDHSLKSRSACITQTVSVHTSIDKKLSKLVKVLRQFYEANNSWILILVKNSEAVCKLKPVIEQIGYLTTVLDNDDNIQLKLTMDRDGPLQAFLATEDAAHQLPLHRVHLILNYDFPSTMAIYQHILTSMARKSVNGMLTSFCTPANASVASQLLQVLKVCLQPVPNALRMLADAATLLQNQAR